MTLLTPPFALGAAGQVLSGKLLRLSLGGAFRHGASGVLGTSGVLYGPPNTMGELSLPSNTVLTVQAFRAVIQSSLDTTAGQYEAINDAAVNLAVTPGDATQYRRSLVVVHVNDSQAAGVASSAATDGAILEIIDGPLAATAGAAQLPNVTANGPNALALGELAIPVSGQPVTLTRYNPRTTTRGGILPVLLDQSTLTGHDGAPGTHDGQARFHPQYGLQAWSASLGVWAGQSMIPVVANRNSMPTTAWEGARVFVTSRSAIFRTWLVNGGLIWATERPYGLNRVTASTALRNTVAGDQPVPWQEYAQDDADSMWGYPQLNGLSGRWIAPVSGYYRVTNHLVVTGAAGITVAARIGTNPPIADPYIGTLNASDSRTIQATNGDDHRHAVAEIAMNAGDKANATVYNSAGAVTISAGWGGSYTSFEYLGPISVATYPNA